MTEKTDAEPRAQYHCGCGQDFKTAEEIKRHAEEHHAKK